IFTFLLPAILTLIVENNLRTFTQYRGIIVLLLINYSKEKRLMKKRVFTYFALILVLSTVFMSPLSIVASEFTSDGQSIEVNEKLIKEEAKAAAEEEAKAAAEEEAKAAAEEEAKAAAEEEAKAAAEEEAKAAAEEEAKAAAEEEAKAAAEEEEKATDEEETEAADGDKKERAE